MFKKVSLILLIGLYLAISNITSADVTLSVNNELLAPPELTWPPEGTSLRYPVTRDTWISSVESEKNGSNGAAKSLKVKGQQEYALIDIDVQPLKGKIISGALLHVRSESADKAPLARLSVSSIASQWVEGKSSRYRTQIGSSCFNHAEYQIKDWAYKGSNFMDVTLGRGNTIWKFSECSKPDRDGWQTCAVDAKVIAARMAGLSYGFSLYDDVGSIWSNNNGKFKYTYFPNRFFYSRESGESRPWLEVWVKGTDLISPDPIKTIDVDTENLPDGQAVVKWKTPLDKGGGETLGFHVTYRLRNKEKEMPRYLIPMAGKTGEEVKMYVRDLPFEPGENIILTIRPVDSTGNIGPSFSKNIRLSANKRTFDLPEADIKTFPPDKNLLTISGIKVAVVDLLDKVDPINGKMIPHREDGYKGGNHIFSSRQKLIRMQAARNETAYFQLNLDGISENISVHYTFEQNQKLKPTLYQFAYVNTVDKDKNIISILPDPLVPVTGKVSIPSKAGIVSIANQTNLSLVCELYVPHEETAGKKRGKLVISAGGKNLEIDVDLTVWDFTLPNKLSFIPEMNAYGTSPFYNKYDYYRLAHEHRTCLNWLPYGWHGLPAFAPKWDGEDFDWSEWDQKTGPLLDGSAFKDLPRRSEPVDVFYLPFNENWPVSVFDNYKPSYWADEAFTERYKEDLGKAFAVFAGHLDNKKWRDTIFQFYLNNKVYYREKFSRSSAPWILDEPVNTQDFWALRWYGILWQSAIDGVKGDAKMWYRGDISFSEYERNILRGIMDIEYLGSNNAQKTRMKREDRIMGETSYFAEYGTANKIDASNTQPAMWCLSAWANGATGILPWQTIGDENSWKLAKETALFYPHPDGPKPSVRLKAFTVGQQAVEYLTLYSYMTGMPKYAIVNWLRGIIDLNAKINRASGSDAGIAVFDHGDIVKLWEMRYRVGKAISVKKPKYKRALVNLETIEWKKRKLPDIGYVAVSPQVESYKPVSDTFKP